MNYAVFAICICVFLMPLCTHQEIIRSKIVIEKPITFFLSVFFFLSLPDAELMFKDANGKI